MQQTKEKTNAEHNAWTCLFVHDARRLHSAAPAGNGSKCAGKCTFIQSDYRQSVEPNVKKMFEGLGIRNAYGTMSAFYVDGKFYFFEAGFRLSGEMSFNYQEALSGINYVDTMLKFALKEPDDDVYHDVVESSKHVAVLNYFVVDGRVGNIAGLEALQRNHDVYSTNVYVKVDDEIKNSTNVFKKGAMVTVIADTHERLIDTITEVNNCFDIISDDDKSLIYERVTKKELMEYYKM